MTQICPHCQQELEISGAFEFVECIHCKSSLEIHENEIVLLKEGKNLSENVESFPSEEGSQEEVKEEVKEEVSEEVIEPPVVDTFESVATVSQNLTEEKKSNEDSVEESLHSSLDESVFDYEVQISHIDSKESMDEIQGILKSKPLNLTKDQWLLSQEKSRIVLPVLSCVKIAFLLRKISHIPSQVTWSQGSSLK